MGALVEYLEVRAAGVARKHRKRNEHLARTQAGLDSAGRLNDDRHLDQLYFMAADLDSHIYGQAMLSSGQPDQWLVKAHVLIEQRALSRRSFTWGGADEESYWWFYRTPAGQYLGAAARRLGSESSSYWQQWQWDRAEAPRGGPWDHDGWTEFDGNYGTPNWTIEPFPSP